MLGEDPTHDALVASALNFVAGLEDIRAVDRQGLRPPDPIDGYTPDVTAVSYGVPVVAEALTEMQLTDPDTIPRLRAFWPTPGEDGERSALHVFVPKGQDYHLRQILTEAGLDPDEEKVAIHTLGFPDR